MSSEQDRARELAERIARRLAVGAEGQGGAPASGAGTDAGTLSATLSEIQRRLAHIEAHISHDGSCEHEARREETSSRASASAPARQQASGDTAARPAWLSGTYVPATISHPSQERFSDIGEAVSELVEMFEREKSCNVEPGGKPCDHCGMCSSRGF